MKVLVGLIAAVLLSAGLVSAPAANAAPYPDTVKTYCHAKLNKTVYHRLERPRLTFWITAANRTPKPAKMKLRYYRSGNVVRTATYSYNGRHTYRLQMWRQKGRYKLVIRGHFADTSVYKDCQTTKYFRVVR